MERAPGPLLAGGVRVAAPVYGVCPADQWQPGCKLLLRRINGGQRVGTPQQGLEGVVGGVSG